MHFGGHAHLRWNIGVTCDHRWCHQVRVSLLSAGGRPRGRQRGCSLILPGPCFPAGPRGRPSARSAQTGASGQDRGWSRGRPPEAGMRGSPGGTVPPSSRREPRRSGPVSEAHLPTRRCVGPAVLCLAAAALARGLQPQDRGNFVVTCVFTLQAGHAMCSISPACRIGGVFWGRVFAWC